MVCIYRLQWVYFNPIIAVMNKLQVDSVLKSFGYKTVLTDVFLECIPGEVIGLIGRNGCGKSTLMQIIFGSLNADQRFVRADGNQLISISESICYISFLPQKGLLLPQLKTKATLALLCPLEKHKIIQQQPFLLPLLDVKIGNLSHGERRLIEILIVLHSPGRYILMDEPFNGVSPIQKEAIKVLIREKSKSKGFIITDHDYRSIIDIATRLLLLRDGTLKSVADVEELEKWGYLPDTDHANIPKY